MSLPLFKALADETRLRLVHILLQYELSVNELVQILEIGQSRVSRHLKILTEAGLLRSRRDGLWVFYSAPAQGKKRDFLSAITPFLPKDRVMANDLNLAAQILEERSRRTKQFFNSIADDWDVLNHEVLEDFDLSAKVLEAMPGKCRVAVDLGCGTGEVLKNLLGHVDMAVGVDGSARMLDICRSRIGSKELGSGEVSLRIGELSHLPLADNEADFACINLVLHHLARPLAIFEEINRVLAPGGILFISDFIAHTDETMRERYGDHWLGFNVPDIEKALRERGFETMNNESVKVGRKMNLFLLTARRLSPASQAQKNDLITVAGK